jgi:protease secretion system outer membrane protein
MPHFLISLTLGIPFKCLFLGGALFVLSATANSMDLLQAYEAAQKNDATILAARATAVAERERLPQAKSQLMPNLSANLSHNKNQLKSVSPNFLGQPQTSHTNYPSSNQTLTLRQPLYRPQLAAQYRQARALVDDAESILQQEEQNVAVRISSAYFEAMLTHDQLALVLAQQTAYSVQLDAARKSFAAGYGIRTDIDEAQSRIDMSRALEIEARQNVSYTLQQLQTLINEPIEKVSTLNVAKLQLQNPQPDSLQDWIARAELNSPQLQSFKARVEVARQEIKKAQAGHLPTLDAVAQWSNSKSESITNTSSSYTNNAIGVQLNIPLFAGGYVNSQVRQTLAGLERAEQSLEAARRDLSLRVHKAFRGVTENIPKIRALEQALFSSDQLVLSSRKSMQAGSRTVLDILNAEQQRVLVLRDLAQARYMYLVSKVRLLALAGDADHAVLASINQALE